MLRYSCQPKEQSQVSQFTHATHPGQQNQIIFTFESTLLLLTGITSTSLHPSKEAKERVLMEQTDFLEIILRPSITY